MDKLQWFKFSPMDWIMGKIQRCPEDTQLRYVRLCCLYWNKETVLTRDEAIIEVDQTHFDTLIQKQIIKTEDNYIRIHFLDEQYSEILSTSEKRREVANKRWEIERQRKIALGMQTDASALQDNAKAMQTDADKSRAEQSKKEEELLCISEIEMTRNEAFELFWDLYKNKKGRDKCEKVFRKLNNDTIQKIIDAVPIYIRTLPKWQEKKLPYTWLNGKHWNDEIEESAATGEISNQKVTLLPSGRVMYNID